MTTPTDWKDCSKDRPCDICGKTDWCQFNAAGDAVHCMRDEPPPPGWKFLKRADSGQGAIYAPEDSPFGNEDREERPHHSPPAEDRQIAEPETLHAVYMKLLEAVKLTGEHQVKIAARGLPDEVIARNMYRSHGLLTWRAIDSLVGTEIARHFGRVPGFAWKPEKERWTLAGTFGIVVPVRNVSGLIIALKIRADKSGAGAKYSYVSSKKHGGPGPGSPIHVPLGTPAAERIRLTEGELKADVIWAITSEPTISAPGVHGWSGAVPVLRELGAKTVVLAMDADWRTNASVARHTKAAICGLVEEGFAVEVEVWSTEGGKGLDDLFAAGGRPDVLPAAEALQQLEQKLAEFEEQETAKREDVERQVSNAETRGEKMVPLSMREIITHVKAKTEDWPRRVDGALFVHDKDEIHWLLSTSAVFGWLQTETGNVRWHRIVGGASKEEVTAELQRTATRYSAVEDLPHEPRITGHYYAIREEYLPGSGEALAKLLDFFCPATDVDRDLIQAALMTGLWGGLPGSRPAFLVTSDDGRGAGKSKVAEYVAKVFGGMIDFSNNEDFSQVKQRLLSAEALTKRFAILDNLKSLRFSWAELEALITAPTISGKRMYVGEASRPNTLTWFITLNGASLSTDIAQRSIIIKVKKPDRSGAWEAEVTEHIDQNRRAIICDLVACLRRTRTKSGFPPTRWATWEREILERLPDPAECHKTIAERQNVADVELEESGLIEEFFEQMLQRLGYLTDEQQVFIPSDITAKWFNKATNEHKSVTGTSRTLRQMASEGKLKKLMQNLCRTYGRGLIWQGSVKGTISVDIRERIADLKRRSKNSDRYQEDDYSNLFDD